MGFPWKQWYHIESLLFYRLITKTGTKTDTDVVLQTPEQRWTIATKDSASRKIFYETLRNTIATLLLKSHPLNKNLVTPSNISRRYISAYKFSSSFPMFGDAVYQGEWKDAKVRNIYKQTQV